MNNTPENMVEPPLIVSIVRMNGANWVKVNRPCDRLMLQGLIAEGLGMCQASDAAIVRPEDCSLRVFITIDDSQTPDF